MSQRSRKTFQQLVSLPDGAVPLAEASLLIACEEYPDLEVGPYVDELEHFADLARSDFRAGDSAREIIAKINEVLFRKCGFRGNSENYYDPRNSFLNDVMDRRLGIPITLSAIYIEVCRRLELPVVGIGLPGHFLLRYRDQENEFFIDPFHEGEILDRDGCRERVESVFSGSLEFSEQFLSRVSNHEILARILNNLKSIYVKGEAYEKGVGVIDLLMLVEPDNPEQLRDRGLLHAQLRHFDAAFKDLTEYVKLSPKSADRAEVEEQLLNLRRIRAMMN